MPRTMFDSVNVMSLPPGADLYAGYDDGAWPDAAAIAARYPGKKVLRITVFPWDNEGDVADVETGDMRPADLPGWLTRRRAAGATFLWAYTSFSQWQACQEACHAADVWPDAWWIAGYKTPLDPTIPAGAAAHQYTDTGSYDISSVVDFIPGFDAPPVIVAPPSYSVEVDVILTKTLVNITILQGHGWTVMDGHDVAHPAIPFSQCFDVNANGSDPTGPGGYVPMLPPTFNDKEGWTQIEAFGHDGIIGVWVTHAA